MGKISIRTLTAADISSLPSIAKHPKALYNTEFRFYQTLSHHNKHGKCFVAITRLQQGLVCRVGYAVCEQYSNLYVIFDLAVHPHFQRQGVGRKLIDRVIRQAMTGGNDTVGIIVPESNRAACEFLKRLGFVSRLYRGRWPDEDGVLFWFRIPNDSKPKSIKAEMTK